MKPAALFFLKPGSNLYKILSACRKILTAVIKTDPSLMMIIKRTQVTNKDNRINTT